MALCRALASQPDLLLLDEPTNHLDAETIRWLEEFLRGFPILAAAGNSDIGKFGFSLRDATRQLEENTFIDVGAIIAALINFVIVAAVVYFVFVAPVNSLMERRKRGEEADVEATPEDILLLQEIRDLLQARNGQV